MHGFIRSLRYTVRLLLKSPGFTITAVLILGFGIGANAAIFSLIDAVLLKPAPYPEPDRLVTISMPVQNIDVMGFDYPDFLDICAAQHSFDNLSISCGDSFDLTGKREPERLRVVFASPSLFKLTRRSFVLGRPFLDDEDKPGSSPVVNSARFYYHQDHNGNVTLITDLSGKAIEGYSYDPFGGVRAYDAHGNPLSGSALQNYFLFQGRELISQLNIYDFRNRAYCATLGRFLQMDPLRFGGGNHLYRFAGNDPVTGSDPLGLSEFDTIQTDGAGGDLPGMTVEGQAPPEQLAPVTVSGDPTTGGATWTVLDPGPSFGPVIGTLEGQNVRVYRPAAKRSSPPVHTPPWDASTVVALDANNAIWQNFSKGIQEFSGAFNTQIAINHAISNVAAFALTGGIDGLIDLGAAGVGESAATEVIESELGGIRLAQKLGKAGEDAVGITGPKVRIEIPGSDRMRIPDALTGTTLTEVKNVSSLSYTRQLRDFATYSQANSLKFDLWVRPTTQLSGPLKEAVANGQITLRVIPGL